jgi:2-dehydro-3-deoxyphosphooctonate aldolase (KDO 8-P synthase)
LNEAVAERLYAITQDLPGVTFYFKSSYDKANRSSIDTYRGPGLLRGLEILSRIKQRVGVPILTDIHHPEEASTVAEVAEVLQIPAFLCRQTDLLVAAGQTGRVVNIKKGQFLAPADIAHGVRKVQSTGNQTVWVTERGSTFGYNNLVADMRAIPIMQGLHVPVIFDATHSVQLPGGQGTTSGGQREFAPVLGRAAVAAGCDGLFFETHPNPECALSDGPNMIPLDEVASWLRQCLAIREAMLNNAPRVLASV